MIEPKISSDTVSSILLQLCKCQVIPITMYTPQGPHTQHTPAHTHSLHHEWQQCRRRRTTHSAPI